MFWFHPGVSWVVSRVQASREEVVDELTVLTTNARRTYIEALLLLRRRARCLSGNAFARRRHLFQRVLLISQGGRDVVETNRCVVCRDGGGRRDRRVVRRRRLSAEAVPQATQAQRSPASRATSVRGRPRPASRRETELKAAIAASPTLVGIPRTRAACRKPEGRSVRPRRRWSRRGWRFRPRPGADGAGDAVRPEWAVRLRHRGCGTGGGDGTIRRQGRHVMEPLSTKRKSGRTQCWHRVTGCGTSRLASRRRTGLCAQSRLRRRDDHQEHPAAAPGQRGNERRSRVPT